MAAGYPSQIVPLDISTISIRFTSNRQPRMQISSNNPMLVVRYKPITPLHFTYPCQDTFGVQDDDLAVGDGTNIHRYLGSYSDPNLFHCELPLFHTGGIVKVCLQCSVMTGLQVRPLSWLCHFPNEANSRPDLCLGRHQRCERRSRLFAVRVREGCFGRRASVSTVLR